jgi:hypothetical protein
MWCHFRDEALLAALKLNALLRSELREIREAIEAKHNPNWRLEPRAPKGTAEGGQWTSGGRIPKGAEEDDNKPRAGHNRPPPDTLHKIFPNWVSAPANSIVAPLDEFLGISGPGYAANEAATRLRRDELIAEIRSINPHYVFESADPGGMPETFEGRRNLIDSLRADRAAALYRFRGETESLKVETLRHLRRRVDEYYTEALRQYNAGNLDIKLSREEAIGNYLDAMMRQDLRDFYQSRGIMESGRSRVRVNRRDYNSSDNDLTYRRPDARIGDLAIDWTLARKLPSNSQIRGFFEIDARPSAVLIIRPSQLDGSSTYLITGPRG